MRALAKKIQAYVFYLDFYRIVEHVRIVEHARIQNIRMQNMAVLDTWPYGTLPTSPRPYKAL